MLDGRGCAPVFLFCGMSAQLIDGKAMAAEIRGELKEQVWALKRDYDTTPGLAVVLGGNRTDSSTYVRMKQKATEEVGIYSVVRRYGLEVSQSELLGCVEELNADPKVHGILVQLPLPSHIDAPAILETIEVRKDADGFSAENIGNLCLRGGTPPLALPCTPAGCVEMLQRGGYDVSGKDAVVVGRSNIVGMPVAQLLQSLDATVTVCHSRTKDLVAHVKRADIVIAAIGRDGMISGDMLKPGAVVIDVGINSRPAPETKKGYVLCGDVDFDSALSVAKAISPVPGGVGPMTIAMLLKNTVNLARHSLGLEPLPLGKQRRRLSGGAAEAAVFGGVIGEGSSCAPVGDGGVLAAVDEKGSEEAGEEASCRRRRSLQQALAPRDEREWLEEWRERIGCWYLALPLPTQTQLGGCIGAFGLHLGSRLDSLWMASLGVVSRSPMAGTAHYSATSVNARCEWIRGGRAALPEIPEFPAFPSKAEFKLPPIPRLLPSTLQLQQLRSGEGVPFAGLGSAEVLPVQHEVALHQPVAQVLAAGTATFLVTLAAGVWFGRHLNRRGRLNVRRASKS